MSGHGQLQGAAVFKALVQGRFEVYPDGVRVILLGLGLVAAHHLGCGGGDRQGGQRPGGGGSGDSRKAEDGDKRCGESDFSSLVGCVLLEDVAGADHHPGGLDPVEGSALLLLHQDLVGTTQGVSEAKRGKWLSQRGMLWGLSPPRWGQRSATQPGLFKVLASHTLKGKKTMLRKFFVYFL